MAAIPFIDIDPLDFTTGQNLSFLNNLLERVPIIWIAMERLGMKDELSAFAAFVGGRDRHFTAKLVRLVRLSLPDALGLRCMPGIKLPAALTRFLTSDLAGFQQGHGEDRKQVFAITNLALDVTDQPAEPRTQELQLAVLAFELFCMGIPSRHHRRMLGDADIGLPQIDTMVLGQFAELFDGLEQELWLRSGM